LASASCFLGERDKTAKASPLSPGAATACPGYLKSAALGTSPDLPVCADKAVHWIGAFARLGHA
jgi:hypothetical protein